MFFTTSRKMADDIQELILKTGGVSSIRAGNLKGSVCNARGKSYPRNHDVLIIYESKKWKQFWFETKARKSQYITEQDYKGDVYCVTTPNGTIYVRKNGKPFWSSNCMRIGNPPGALVSSIYKNLSKIIEAIADGKDVEPEFRSPYGAELSIESTEQESVPFGYDVKKDLHRIKLRLATNIKGQYFNVMSNCGTQVVKAIGFGDSMEEAEFECMQAAENFKCKGKTYNKNAFDDLEEDIKTGEKFGLGKF